MDKATMDWALKQFFTETVTGISHHVIDILFVVLQFLFIVIIIFHERFGTSYY
jgi:hypothetical protein